MKSTKHIWGLDLETDTDGQDRAFIVQWALVHSGGRNLTGRSLDSLETALVGIFEPRKDVYIYSHNMTYDAHFFKYCLPSIAQQLRADITIVKPQSKIITIKLKCKDGGTLHFRDSMAKMPGDLRSLGRIIGLDKLDGFDWSVGWSTKVNFDDPANWAYVIRDAEICAKAMYQLHKSGHTSATSSGDAWRLYKNTYHPEKWQKYFPMFSYNFDLNLRLAYSGGLNFSFHKGYNLSTDRRRIRHRDAVSMYPWAMTANPMPYDKPTKTDAIPADGALYIAEFYAKMTLKPDRPAIYMFKQKVDCILEGIAYGTPLEKCDHYHKIVITSVDFETLLDYYDFVIDWEREPVFYVFKSRRGMFDEYIKEQADAKNNAPPGSLEREKAKLLMNGLYGRFALNPEITETKLEFSLDDLSGMKFKSTTILNDENDAYLPISIFVTAFARQHLIRSAEKIGWKNLIHADTDSLIYYEDVPNDLSEYKDQLPSGKQLGQWKNESYPVAVWEGGVKRYFEILKDPITGLDCIAMACAGVPQRVDKHGVPVGMWVEILDDPAKIASEDLLGRADYRIKSTWLRSLYYQFGLDPDRVNTFKLIPVQCEGGIILDERQHQLNDTMALRFRYRGRK